MIDEYQFQLPASPPGEDSVKPGPLATPWGRAMAEVLIGAGGNMDKNLELLRRVERGELSPREFATQAGLVGGVHGVEG